MTSRVLSVGGPSSLSSASLSAAASEVASAFMLSKMKEATKEFDDSLELGIGGYGMVYKGTIFDDDTNDFLFHVAVKRARFYNTESMKQYLAEVELLSQLSHQNVVSLIGYCNDEVSRELILVYEYMHNGTLHDRLHEPNGRPPLTWVRRLKICLGAARGLNYLHSGTHFTYGVLHRDIKSANLLLDKFFGVKICDFGLAKTGPPGVTSDYAKGSDGYVDPEYLSTAIPTQKSDVYAFGVIMFEVFCGTKARASATAPDEGLLARKAPKFFRLDKLHEIVDSNIKEMISPKCLNKFAKLATQCVDPYSKKRPTMAKVVARLESILVLQEKTSKISSNKSALKSLGFNRKKENVDALELHLNTVGGENRTLHQFDIETIDAATENFNEANRILISNLGTMYKGKLQSGEDIAIVSGHYSTQTLDEVYENQTSVLVKLEHENVIQFHGYCVEKTMVYLLFDCAPYASLESLIFDPDRPLDWEKRYKILLGVAQAILYLHMDALIQVINVAVTPCNIIVDESWNPKLSGHCFVASRVPDASGHIEPSMDRWIGNSVEQRYLSTDIMLSAKSDTFSYGVLILETMTGRRRKYPCNELLEDVVRNSLQQETVSDLIVTNGEGDFRLIERYLMVGVLCTQEDAADRPTMKTVVEMLLGNSTASDGLFSKMRALNVRKWKMKVRDIKKGPRC